MDAQRLKLNVRLMVHGFSGSPAEIGAILGLEASETWRVGDSFKAPSIHRHKESGWVLRSPLNGVSDNPAQAVEALQRLVTSPAAFKRLPKDAQVTLSLGIMGMTARPSFDLPAGVVAWIAQIGAALDVDVYDLTSTNS